LLLSLVSLISCFHGSSLLDPAIAQFAHERCVLCNVCPAMCRSRAVVWQ
jgi:MinD superfamily P-loop ATPase